MNVRRILGYGLDMRHRGKAESRKTGEEGAPQQILVTQRIDWLFKRGTLGGTLPATEQQTRSIMALTGTESTLFCKSAT